MKELFLESGVKGSDRKPVVTPGHLVFSHETGQRSLQPSTNLSFMAEWPDRSPPSLKETSVEHVQVSQTLWSESSWSGGISAVDRDPARARCYLQTTGNYSGPDFTLMELLHTAPKNTSDNRKTWK